MGLVVVISLPLIFFCLLLGFGCYFLGRAKGRQDIRTNAQVFGVPTPPPGSSGAAHSTSSPQPLFKPDNSTNVWLVIRSKFNSSLYCLSIAKAKLARRFFFVCECVNSVLSVWTSILYGWIVFQLLPVLQVLCMQSNKLTFEVRHHHDDSSTLLQLQCLNKRTP